MLAVKTIKSDAAAKIGRHVFEVAGLGRAPFRCIDVVTKKFQAAQGAPVLPGGSCAFCGNGIMFCCVVVGADGKPFEVGSDCVARTSDSALVKSYKSRPEVRAMNRAKAAARDERVKAEWAALMADETACAKLNAISVTDWRGNPETWLSFAKRAWTYCGAAGRARYLKGARHLLSETTHS